MNARLRRLSIAPLALVAIALPLGCLAPNARDAEPALPRAELDRYRLTTGEARSLAGCRYAYRVYEPIRPAGDDPVRAAGTTTVLLGHGFLRDQDTLVDLARALANAGHPTATLDFCNMRPWSGNHERNARDLVALAERLGAEDVVYAGFSAGALAAVLAGASDPATRAVVTLDLVDQGELAVRALDTLDAPLVGLQGPPSACNANGSGQRVYGARPDAPLETLAGASHCEFESPTNRLCEIACGDEDARADDERVRGDIIDRVVGIVRRLTREAAVAPTGAVPSVGALPRL